MMNFIPKLPSLEHITFIKISASLWNQHDIRTSVTEFSRDTLFLPLGIKERKEIWQEIENRVLDKTLQLVIPRYLKEKISAYIQTVGLQILIWLYYHLKYCHLALDLPNEFSWTPHGTIDKRKAAEVIISDESIDITTRFKLACIYCLADDIPKLWNKVPESDKESFYTMEDPNKILQIELVEFWVLHIKGEYDWLRRIARIRLNHVCSPYQYAFECAMKNGSKTGTEYFLQKLDSRETLRAALSIVEARHDLCSSTDKPPKEYSTEVLCFLLSEMSSGEQEELLKRYPLKALYCFLDCPWQSLFVEMSSCVWNFLSRSDYHSVFIIILYKVQFGCKDYNYEKLFHDVWKQVPEAYKNYIINDSGSLASLLNMLLHVEDKENTKLVFKDTTLLQKHKLIFSTEGQSLCKNMVIDDKWDSLKFIVKLLISSKDEMIEFKQQFEKHIYVGEKQIFKDKFDEFTRIIDDFVLKYDERKKKKCI